MRADDFKKRKERFKKKAIDGMKLLSGWSVSIFYAEYKEGIIIRW